MTANRVDRIVSPSTGDTRVAPPALGRPLLIIPAYNEARNLPAVLRDLRAAALDLEVVVLDDGSTDETAAVAAAGGAYVVRHPFNLGYGTALQTGYKLALARRAPLLVQMDADGQHRPDEIAELVEPVRRGDADLAVGSRFLEPTSYDMGPLKRLGRGLFRILAGWAGLRVTDPTSGFQAMNERVLQLYVTDFFPTDFPDIDVLLTAHRHGLRIRECPVHMDPAPRKSSLHSGLRPLYYVYRTALALWVAASRVRQDDTR
jgi:glycosyltransferase involved in cell wall biosynthesis